MLSDASGCPRIAKVREFEIVASEVNLGKRFFMSGLAVDMRSWTEESGMDGWQLFREKLAKCQ